MAFLGGLLPRILVGVSTVGGSEVLLRTGVLGSPGQKAAQALEGITSQVVGAVPLGLVPPTGPTRSASTSAAFNTAGQPTPYQPYSYGGIGQTPYFTGAEPWQTDFSADYSGMGIPPAYLEVWG